MHIKIKHPTEWAAATMLRRGLATGIVIFAFLYFAPLEEIFCSGGGQFCTKAVSFGAFLAFAAALFLIVVPVYILYRERHERRKNGPDVTALEFTAQGVSVYRPPLTLLFFPYTETAFELTAKAAVKRSSYLYSYVVPAVQIKLTNAAACVSVPHRISSLRRVLPLLDMRQKFASFSLHTEPLEKPKKTRAEKTEPPEVSEIRRILEDYMQYGVLPPMSGDMRITFELFGLFFIGAAGYFYFKLFGLSAPDVPGVLILLLPFMGGAALLYAAAKHRKTQRRLERLRGKKSKKD